MDKKVIKLVIIIVLLVSLVVPSSAKGKGRNNNNNDSANGKGWNLFSWFSRGHGKTHIKKQKTSFFGGLFTLMGQLYSYIWKLSFVVFIVKLARQLYQGYQQYRLKEQQKKVFKEFKESCLAEPSVLTNHEQNGIIQDLGQKMLVINVQSKDGLMALNSRLNASCIKRLTNIAYYVRLQGSDELGKCRMDGYLGFTKDGFKIRLVKLYQVQLPAEQKGNGSKLVFQGFGNAAEASGQWLQLGHQNDSKYSGTWTLVSQTQQQ